MHRPSQQINYVPLVPHSSCERHCVLLQKMFLAITKISETGAVQKPNRTTLEKVALLFDGQNELRVRVPYSPDHIDDLPRDCLGVHDCQKLETGTTGV